MSHSLSSWTLIPSSSDTNSTAGAIAFTPGRDWALNEDGDIDLSTGDLRFTTELEAVAQDLFIAIMTFKGEWFLDESFGVPYLPNDSVVESDALLGQKFSVLKSQAAFRTAMERVETVESIRKLSISFVTTTRTLRVDFEVVAVSGTIIGSVGV